MKGTTKSTEKQSKEKKPPSHGGKRAGAGRKATGKKYFSYFIDPDIGDKVSLKEKPSEFAETALKKALK